MSGVATAPERALEGDWEATEAVRGVLEPEPGQWGVSGAVRQRGDWPQSRTGLPSDEGQSEALLSNWRRHGRVLDLLASREGGWEGCGSDWGLRFLLLTL